MGRKQKLVEQAYQIASETKNGISNVADDHDCICHHNPRYGDIHYDHVDYGNDDDVSCERIHVVNLIDFDAVF